MNNLQAISQLKFKTGTIAYLGDHVLCCGKAEDKELVKRLLGERKIHLILTDPPYGVCYVEGKADLTQIKKKEVIVGDHNQSEQEYLLLSRSWIQAVKPFLSIPNSVYVFNADKMALSLKQAIELEGGKFSQLLIWAKSRSVIGRLDYNPQHELIIYGWFGKHEFYKSKDKSILCYPKPDRSPWHPTSKPIPLLRHLILNSTKMGDTVWDGFGGGGSTLIACEQTRRKCVMTEISPEYCLSIVKRFQKIFPDKKVEIVEP